MALYIIGLGLWDERGISLKGVDAVSRCRTVYLETYTSRMNCTLRDLEKLFNKKIIVANRELVENQTSKIIGEAKTCDVAFLVPGAPFAATTHIELLLEARKQNVGVKVIENASIITAVAITGLFIYKFGRTTTVPFENENIKSPYEVYLNNKKLELHTLFLLDIKEDKMMTIREALDYLMRCGLNENTLCVGIAALGSENPEIKTGRASTLSLSKFPQSLIIPGELNFKEEEALKLYKI